MNTSCDASGPTTTDRYRQALSAADRALLDLEADWQAGRLHGDKETLIAERLSLSTARYHQRLNEMIDDPVARQASPALLGRLGRAREERRAARAADNLPR